jgi:2-polyprenyl-3-methyl-5-hydroxy-6-metoxy-1,4-benzoquinol methylase
MVPSSPRVPRWLPLINVGGTVLDVASGHGRHTRTSSHAGLRVVAADVDVSDLEHLKDDPRVEIVAVDLESKPWPLAGCPFVPGVRRSTVA